MWRFITQLLKRFLNLNFSRFFIVISLLSALIPAYALDSIWYSDKDLKEGNIQLIPDGYIDPSMSDPCSQKTYDKALSLVDVLKRPFAIILKQRKSMRVLKHKRLKLA